MAKTAMQELIANMSVNIGLYDISGNTAMAKAYTDITKRATELLEKEKEQIENAYTEGWNDRGNDDGDFSQHESPEDYYNKTHNQ